MTTIQFRVFKAKDDPESSYRFQEGHIKVLTDFGIENLNSTKPEWMDDSNVYVVLAEDDSGEVVGGLRIHSYDGSRSLPIIDALEYLDPRIRGIVENLRPAGTAEICSLWNSKKVFGKGVSPVLCMCSVVVVAKAGLTSFVCFSAPYTEKMIMKNGCYRIRELGNDGYFNYPTEAYVSSVLINPDVHKLEFAEEYNKQRIRALVENGNQIFEEPSPRENFKADYHLNLEVSQKI